MLRSRNWCFTLNNYDTTEEQALQEVDCKYMIVGRETGELTWTHHLQGFIVFKTMKSLNQMKELNPRAHWEIANGTAEQNIAYCSKQDKIPFIKGVPPKSQKEKGEMNKRRYEEAFIAAKEGRIEDIPKDMLTRHYNTYLKIQRDYQPNPAPLEDTCGIWIYGPPGVGKSHEVCEKYPDAYQKNLNKWWDGYRGHDVVWLDEIAPEHASWIVPFLKKWACKFPFPAEFKGSQLQIRPKKVIVTSNYSLEDLGLSAVDYDALARRFSQRKKNAREIKVLQ